MNTRQFRVMIPLLAALVVFAGCGSNDAPKIPDLSLQQLVALGLVVTPAVVGSNFPAGTPVTFVLNITNNSNEPRTVDLISNQPQAYPPLRFLVSVASGEAIFLGDVMDVTPVTIQPGETLTIATFVWDQTNRAGAPVSPGTFTLSAQIGGFIVDGQTIVNPYGTIFFRGASFRVVAAPD